MILVLLLGLLGGLLFQKPLKASKLSAASGSEADDSRFQAVTEEELRIENERIAFTMDTATTHFEVLDKTTGKSYQSVAGIDPESGKNSIYLSEIVIDYFDGNSMENTMYSRDNSVEFGTYEVKSFEDSVRVYYEIRKMKDDFFVPAVFTQKVFEEKILAHLEAGAGKRLQKYYTLCSADRNKDQLSKYPELANQDLYIVAEMLGTTVYREITGFFQDAGYTQEDYKKDTDGMNISESAVDLPAQFLVPVEYQVNEDGFTARVLTDLIETGNDSYTLTNVQLLPSFGSAAEYNTGYFFVPDGAGGLISFAEQADASFSLQVYGVDRAVDIQQSRQLAEQVVLPVFGMNRVDSGYFAIIEKAAEAASVSGQVLGATNKSSGIYAEFALRAYDITDIGSASEVGVYNLYAQEMLHEQPGVRYILLGEDNCDYSSMADCYREYLAERGVLGEQMTEGGTALYLDFTGYVTQEASFLGIPYDKKIVLSKVESIEAIVKELQGQGVGDLSIRLKAYSYGGTENSLMDSFKITSAVGTAGDIRSLAAVLKENDGILYLDDVADVVYKDSKFDRFRKRTHAAQRINRMAVRRGDYDIVYQETKKVHSKYFAISPRYYEALVQGFAETLEKKLGDKQDYGYSWGNYGSSLTGDYNHSAVIDRVQARKFADSAIAGAEGFASILTDGGNMYAAAYADTLLNVPLSNSAFRFETESVPFYQMVLHGYRSFAGAPLNAVTDVETEWLHTIESGASMYYSCMTEDYTLIKDMENRQKLYPISTESCCKAIVSRYQEYAGVFEKLSAQRIVKHEINEDGLRLTTYEDGTTVAVNYSNDELVWGDIAVGAKSFAVQ